MAEGHTHNLLKYNLCCVQHSWHPASWGWGEQPATRAASCMEGLGPDEELPVTFPLCSCTQIVMIWACELMSY